MTDLSRRSFVTTFSVFAAVVWIGAGRAENLSADSGVRVALRGYDPVSYFTDGRPEQGLEQFSASFDDDTYWFTNEAHRAMFVANPEAYAPQYKGHCAISVSRGVIAEPNPEAWIIADGKLYVFQAKMGVAMFQKQTATILAGAAENWPKLQKGL
jgi:YHS domain-containing protein